MEYNCVNIIIAVILLFGVGVALSRFGGVGVFFYKIKKKFRCLIGYRE